MYVLWDPIIHEHYLHCILPYSKFCKEDLMLVKLNETCSCEGTK